jgi:two-component system chemotaxis response regulator CheB
MSKKIKVLIVDDSALIRMLLTNALSSSDEIEVVGTAEDPLVARDLIKQKQPDVLTLDIEMPKMDGITFLKNLMRLRPMPVIMISTLTKKGANVTLKALEYGAVDFVAKPDTDIKDNLMAYSSILIDKVKAAAKANVGQVKLTSQSSVDGSSDSGAKAQETTSSTGKTSRHKRYDLIAIGASTGGTEAIKAVVTDLPPDLPPIVMTQHIPPVFSTSFANRLNTSSRIRVIEPTESVPLENGHAYLAPGDKHMIVVSRGGRLYAQLDDGPEVNRHKPSVEVMFSSVARVVKKRCITVMLTGMGADGAEAMKRLHDLGSYTICQDEDSSVVWGMPGAVVQLDGAHEQLPVTKIGTRLKQLLRK